MSVVYMYQGGFTNVSQALQDILSEFLCCTNRPSYEKSKLKLCMCAQSHALGTRTKIQLEILTVNVISGIMYFREKLIGNMVQKYFSARNIFFPHEIFFSARKIFFPARKIFFRKK